jgi:hypothetical protein
VVVTLTYLRRNRVQAELAETYGVSQPTVSRAVTVMTALLGEVLRRHVPTADDLDGQVQYVVDGTLLPCWSWASCPALYSGKHKTTGMNVHVACPLSGAWRGSPIRSPGTGTTRTASASPGCWRHSIPATGSATKDTWGIT